MGCFCFGVCLLLDLCYGMLSFEEEGEKTPMSGPDGAALFMLVLMISIIIGYFVLDRLERPKKTHPK